MEEGRACREDKILFYTKEDLSATDIQDLIRESIPSATVIISDNPDDYSSKRKIESFDVIVLDDATFPDVITEYVRELKLSDHEPAVVVLSKHRDPKSVSDYYLAGCLKCIIKEINWLNELLPSLRHLLRIRRLEEENQRLLAKLTEANMLLEEKNKRLDEFSATVAHDIRGPLGGISMKLDYIIEAYSTKLDERCGLLLRRTSAATERLMGVLQAMYEYAKLGSQAAKMREVNLDQLVRDVISDLEVGESLDIKVGIDRLPTVWGNPDLLRRVFINLIGNAIKYNDKEEIVINIGIEKTEERSLARFSTIFIQDNGPGISKEDSKNIFSMFARGKSNSSKQEGLGVGLSVVQRIIDLHFGKVSLESKVGEGAKFLISLPLDEIGFIR